MSPQQLHNTTAAAVHRIIRFMDPWVQGGPIKVWLVPFWEDCCTVPKIPCFLRGRKTLDPHNSDQVVTKDTKYCHLDNLFLQVHLGVQSLLASHIFASQPNFAGKVRQLMGGHIICDICILKGSSQKACHPWSQHHVPCTRCRVNPSFTHKKTQLDHSSQNKNVKPFQVW